MKDKEIRADRPKSRKNVYKDVWWRGESGKLAKSYIEHLAVTRYAERTVNNRRVMLNAFLKFLHEAEIERLEDVDLDTLEHYRSQLFDADFTPGSMLTYLRAVRALFAWLEQRSLIFENPTVNLALPKEPEPSILVIDEATAARLLDAPDPNTVIGKRDRAILELLYSVGLRRDELLRLKVGDVSLAHQTMRVQGKGSVERVVPLGVEAVERLTLYLIASRVTFAQGRDFEALFLSFFCRPCSNSLLDKIIPKYALLIGRTGISPHTLRRSCASHLLSNGAHPIAVANLLGHANLHSLAHYLRVPLADIQRTHANRPPGE